MKKEEIQKFMKKVDKTKKPKHWQKFINKNVIDDNIIIKYGKRAFCTHCNKFFEEEINVDRYTKSKCPRCKKEFYVKNHGIRNCKFLSDISFFVKVDNKIVLRVFEIKSKYNCHTKKIEHKLKEYLRFIPGDGIYINNTIHFFYFAVRVDHLEKITNWRKYNGNKFLYNVPIYRYNKKALFKNTFLEYAPLNEFKNKYPYFDYFRILHIANNPSFEYLWKMGLHNLALDSDKFKKKGQFSKKIWCS